MDKRPLLGHSVSVRPDRAKVIINGKVCGHIAMPANPVLAELRILNRLNAGASPEEAIAAVQS